MEYKSLADGSQEIPPVPIKTYQWEDLRRARELGGYPWTHIYKPALVGQISAEDILRETTPHRSMSREISKERSRTRSPVDTDMHQKILLLDASPGSCRKHNDDGEDLPHVPNFSKEISLDSEEDPIDKAVNRYLNTPDENTVKTSSQSLYVEHIPFKYEKSKSVSPKGILKKRLPNLNAHTQGPKSMKVSKCCHNIVDKLKTIADKKIHKRAKSPTNLNQTYKLDSNKGQLEIIQLKSSPSEKKKKSGLKLGDSDEVSDTLLPNNNDKNIRNEKKDSEHIYEDLEQGSNIKLTETEKSIQIAPEVLQHISIINTDGFNDAKIDGNSLLDQTSNGSQDPSLFMEGDTNDDLQENEHIMETLHKDLRNEAIILEIDDHQRNRNIDIEEIEKHKKSPNITITEIFEESNDEALVESATTIDNKNDILINTIKTSKFPKSSMDSSIEDSINLWSTQNSDHEYELIGKPSENVKYNKRKGYNDQSNFPKTDDDLSSTSSLERKYLRDHFDEDINNFENDDVVIKDHANFNSNDEDVLTAEDFQQKIDDRYFVNTPSMTDSRTECEISTSQVESSALENLPLKRESRIKSEQPNENKLQQKIRVQTGKLRLQASKLRTKLQNIKKNQIKMPDKPRFSLPDKPKFQFPERPKFNLQRKTKTKVTERPNVLHQEREHIKFDGKTKQKKVNLTDRINFSELKTKLSERPKFTMPDLSKFKLPEKSKIQFPGFNRQPIEKKTNDTPISTTESSPDSRKKDTNIEFRTYPRLLSRKKQINDLRTSSPTINRADTPPPIFNFTKRSKILEQNNVLSSIEVEHEPYSQTTNENISYLPSRDDKFEENAETEINHFNKIQADYDAESRKLHQIVESKLQSENTSSLPNINQSTQNQFNHVDEINSDEFFIRQKGISRDNIEVRKYLSNEIREAFKVPTNTLALMSNYDQHLSESKQFLENEDMDPPVDMEIEIQEFENINETNIDDGYYTFPPVRPRRVKKHKICKDEDIKFIDQSTDNINSSTQFSEVDIHDYNDEENCILEEYENTNCENNHEYFEIDSPKPVLDSVPSIPKRRKKSHISGTLHDEVISNNKNHTAKVDNFDNDDEEEEVIVFRTEHEYIMPEPIDEVVNDSPIPPRRSHNKSRGSRTTSIGDDDRTSHGAESLTLDPHIPPSEFDYLNEQLRESPGYAVVDKYSQLLPKRRSKSKTPPYRRRKSHSSERNYNTINGSINKGFTDKPERPSRKKSTSSLHTLNSLKHENSYNDITQYVEIDDGDELHKNLQSGEIINKMKDRPLPPPPRPPRGARKKYKDVIDDSNIKAAQSSINDNNGAENEEIIEVEVSTQTDPLPYDIDFEMDGEECFDDIIDNSVSSSIKDILEDESFYNNPKKNKMSASNLLDIHYERQNQIKDPKITDISKTNVGRTSPTVILVEKRVSSPTKINEREEMLHEASLTVQHIDLEHSLVPGIPPLPKTNNKGNANEVHKKSEEIKSPAIKHVSNNDKTMDIQLENLVTQKLQVNDLDVGRLNVSELQASKILVSEMEGLSLHVSELDTKSGHISVKGIELAPGVIDEIVRKFFEISAENAQQNRNQMSNLIQNETEVNRIPTSREEETQTEMEVALSKNEEDNLKINQNPTPPPSPQISETPLRPPPPDLSPLLLSYLQDISVPPASFFQLRNPNERHFNNFYENTPPPPLPVRRAKRKPIAHVDSSSDEEIPSSSRRLPNRTYEPSLTELGAQFWRVCHSSVSRAIRSIIRSVMSYISGSEDKKDVQMALVIFLVLIAGLIMFGLSDGRTVHHHHWEFFNPPDNQI